MNCGLIDPAQSQDRASVGLHYLTWCTRGTWAHPTRLEGMNRMQLHDANSDSAQPRRAHSRRRSALTRALAPRAAALSIGVACAMPIACGDDGTDGLSSCPDSKIILGKDDRLHCAPRAGGPAPTTMTMTMTTKPAPASNTGTSSPSTGAGAANSGGNKGPAIPIR
jgi:hypothetical protein